MMLRCLIVDDEPIARQGLCEYVRSTDFLCVEAEAGSAAEAQQVLLTSPIDLLLLDVQMPGKTGLDFLRDLTTSPLVIMVTAYSEFALDGFELDVVDYLVKPVSYNRFLKAATKALDLLTLRLNPQTSSKPAYMFIKSNGRFERIFYDEITCVEGMQNYIMIHTVNHKLMVYMTMTAMEAKLPTDLFVRVHKSFIVSLKHVQALDGHTLIIGQARVPVSRSLLDSVRAKILGSTLLKR